MATLFPTKQIPTIHDFLAPKNPWATTDSGGNQQSIFAAKPLDTSNPGIITHPFTVTGAAATGSPGGQVQNVTATTQTNGLAGTPQTVVATPKVATAPANPFYTPTTPDGQFIAGAQVADHTDPGVKYTWSIGAGDREGGGATMLTSYNGNNDHARWSYAQNSNETSWDHWDRLRHDLVKKYGMTMQAASDEALREMYAAYQAAGKDWSETGFGAVPGVKQAASGTGAGNGTGAGTQDSLAPPVDTGGSGSGSGSGGGSGDGTTTTSGNMGPYNTTQADVFLTGENGQDPQAALREAMRRQGVNLDSPGLMSEYIKSRFTPMAQALMGTAGLGNGGDKYGEVNNLIQLIGQGLLTPGVNMGTQLQQRARNITGSSDFANSMKNVDQNQAIDYLKTLGLLDTFGSPELMAAAASNQFKTAENQFRDQSFGLIPGVDPKTIPDFLTWFRQHMANQGLFGF